MYVTATANGMSPTASANIGEPSKSLLQLSPGYRLEATPPGSAIGGRDANANADADGSFDGSSDEDVDIAPTGLQEDFGEPPSLFRAQMRTQRVHSVPEYIVTQAGAIIKTHNTTTSTPSSAADDAAKARNEVMKQKQGHTHRLAARRKLLYQTLEALSPTELRDRVMLLDADNIALKQATKSLEHELAGSQSELSDLVQELAVSETERMVLESEKAQIETSASDLEAELQCQKKDTSELLLELEQARQHRARTDVDNQLSAIENAAAQESVQVSSARLERLETESIAVGTKMAELERQRDSTHREATETQSALSGAKYRIGQLEDDLDRMCNGVADLELQLTATQQLAVSDRRRLQEKADGLETELAGANQAAAKLERELSSARSQLKVKEDDHAADRASALRSRAAFEDQQHQVADLESMLDEASETIARYEHTMQTHGLGIDGDGRISLSATARPSSTSTLGVGGSDAAEQVELLQQELENAGVVLSDLEEQLSVARSENVTLQEKCRKVTAVLDNVEGELNGHRVDIDYRVDMEAKIGAIKKQHLEDLAKLQLKITLERADDQWFRESAGVNVRKMQLSAMKAISESWLSSFLFNKTRSKVEESLKLPVELDGTN